MHTDGSTIQTLFGKWRLPPWPLRAWRSTSSAYRASVLATGIGACLVIAAALYALGEVHLDAGIAVFGAVVAGALSTTMLRYTAVTFEDTELAIGVSLAIAGWPLEGALAVVVARIVGAVRKPLPVHLIAANVLNGTAITIASGAAASAVPFAEFTPAWVVAVYGITLVTYTAVAVAVTAAAIAEGYHERGTLVAHVRDGCALFVVMLLPMAIFVAWAIAGGGGAAQPTWSLSALLIMPITMLTLSARADLLMNAREDSLKDPLTGVANQRKALQDMAAAIDDGRIDGVQLMAINLGGVDDIAERHGRDAGDHARIAAATQLQLAVGNTGTVYRMGGDAFLVMCATQYSDSADLATTVRRRLYASLGFFGVTVAVGQSTCARDDSVAAALDRADAAARLDLSRDDARVAVPTTIVEDESAERYWSNVATQCAAAGDRYGNAKALYQQYWASPESRRAAPLAAAASDEDAYNGWAQRARAAQHSLRGNFESALQHDEVAVSLARERGDWILEVTALLAQAYSQRQRGDHDAAINCAHEAFAVAVRQHAPRWIGSATEVLARLHVVNIDARAALASIDEAAAWIDVERESWVSALRCECAMQEGHSSAVGEVDDLLLPERRALRAARSGDLDSAFATLEAAQPSPLRDLAVREVRALRISDSDELRAVRTSWKAHRAVVDAAWCTTTIAALAGRKHAHEHVSALRDAYDVFVQAGDDSGASRAREVLAAIDGRASKLLELDSNPVFASLDGESRRALRQALVVKTVEPGDLVALPGAGEHEVGFVVSGAMRQVRHAPNGKELTVALLGPGAVVGEHVVMPEAVASTTTEALTKGVLLVAPRDRVEALFASHPDIHSALLATVAQQVRHSAELAEQIAYWPLGQRVAHVLLQLDEQFGRPTLSGERVIDVPLSQEQIAALVGATRQAVAKHLQELRATGVISVERKITRICDRSALQERAQRPAA